MRSHGLGSIEYVSRGFMSCRNIFSCCGDKTGGNSEDIRSKKHPSKFCWTGSANKLSHSTGRIASRFELSEVCVLSALLGIANEDDPTGKSRGARQS